MRRRAVILPVVLFILALIGLLAAMFSFRVHADLSATQAVVMRMQTRLAAEAGVEYVRLLLRDARFDRNFWYHNPEIFNRIIVSAHGREAEIAGTNEEIDENMVYRFSIVADDPTDDKDYIRLGITDEAAKLNLNTATEDQLRVIVTAAMGEETDIDPQTIVDAILDWRDSDGDPRGEVGDTEGEYYRTLPKPYRVKNGPFDTVEELLLVKGVTPAILYGEDFDRNGLITENEKDGDRTFPADNQDEVLNRGLYPYLTVMSRENNVANNNRPRIYLGGEAEVVRSELSAIFPDEPDVVDYIVTASRKPPAEGQGPGDRQGGQGGRPRGPQGGDARGPKNGGKPPPGQQGNQTQQGDSEAQPEGTGQPSGDAGDPKDQRRQQRRQQQPGGQQPAGGQPRRGGQGQPGQSGAPGGGAAGPQGAPSGDQGAEGGGPQGQPAEGEEEPSEQGDVQTEGQPGGEQGQEGQEGQGGAEGEGGDQNPPLTSPASLMLERTADGQPVHNPLTIAHLAVLMDKTTTVKPDERAIPGLINVNTAPRLVLECLEGLTSELIDGILAMRGALDAETASTTAWLVSEGLLDVATYEKIAPHITARAQQFTIESVGFADHMGMVTRLQVVVDMNGPIAQTIYYRDISNLGGAYPIREEDKDKIRAR